MSIISKHNQTRLYTSVLLSMFDMIQIQRRDDELYTVPIYQGNQDRYTQTKNKSDGNLIYESVVPRMSLSFQNISIDLTRQTNKSIRKKYLDINDTQMNVSWNDTPVDLDFTLKVVSKTKTELFQILEFIMSSFKNTLYYVNVDTPFYKNVSTPIRLNTTSPEIENYEDEFDKISGISAELDITIKGFFHNNIDVSNNNTVDKITSFKLLGCWLEDSYEELIID